MLPIALAVVASLSWGFSAVVVRLGLRDVSTQVGTLVSLVTGFVITTLLVILLQFDDLTSLSLKAVALFFVIGTLNFPMGRFLNYMAMGRLGVGRSTPILASSPLFAVILAVVFTGEELHLATAAGTALILAGLYVTLRPASPRSHDAQDA